MPAPTSPGESRLAIRLAWAESRTARATVATGFPVLDHLLGVLAEWGRFDLALETPPSGGEQEVDAVGRALGRAFAGLAAGRPGYGSAFAPADEALAQVVVEASGRPLVVANVDLSGEHVGGLGTDLVARLLEALAEEAGLTLHVRLIEGEDAGHVLEAIFKALGLALRQAYSTVEGG